MEILEKQREFFLNGVAEEAQRRLAEWPKRRRQILDGYHKFVTPVIKGDHLTMLRKNDLQEEIISPEEWENQAIRNDYELREYSEKQAECLFLRSLFLQLCLVPHRKVAAWESPGRSRAHGVRPYKNGPITEKGSLP